MLAALAEVLGNPGMDPADWPSAWWEDLDGIAARFEADGYAPEKAAEFARQHLMARARLRRLKWLESAGVATGAFSGVSPGPA